MRFTKMQIAGALGISEPRINQIIHRMQVMPSNTFVEAEVKAILSWVATWEHRSVKAEVPAAIAKLRLQYNKT